MSGADPGVDEAGLDLLPVVLLVNFVVQPVGEIQGGLGLHHLVAVVQRLPHVFVGDGHDEAGEEEEADDQEGHEGQVDEHAEAAAACGSHQPDQRHEDQKAAHHQERSR
ncbi:hypothetical protein V6N11_015265 [Hibiscus sabdariffa]|uniref:Uncharacterized protein n=1 Tax=Hibiscus sabdariffa TaxID=183260 RepID=A0ABR2TS91_9ROSI